MLLFICVHSCPFTIQFPRIESEIFSHAEYKEDTKQSKILQNLRGSLYGFVNSFSYNTKSVEEVFIYISVDMIHLLGS